MRRARCAGWLAAWLATGCAKLLDIDHEYDLASDADASVLDAGLDPDAGFDCAQLAGKVLDGHCYFVIAPGTGLVWSRAQSTCEEFEGAHLASVTSADEQAALEAAFFPSTADYWIGLALEGASNQTPPASCKTNPRSCPFLWVSGEELSFTKWSRRSANDVEPNYTGACVRLQLTDKSWADYGCGTQLPAICEHE